MAIAIYVFDWHHEGCIDHAGFGHGVWCWRSGEEGWGEEKGLLSSGDREGLVVSEGEVGKSGLRKQAELTFRVGTECK